MTSIAIILPDTFKDYIADGILDGFRSLEQSGKHLVRISPRFVAVADYSDWELDDAAFLEFAKKSDLIIYIHAKYTTKDLVNKIGLWEKTVCIDATEVGKNARYDFDVQKGLLDGTYQGGGAIQYDLLKKCRRYFRREKPYLKGIIPFPFGIETDFIRYTVGQKKDIDFTCIFGQDEYPLMRKHATEILKNFCKKNGFTCETAKTNSLLNRDPKSEKSRGKFYDILARTKVGISVGGGGFDTLRFWEILANNCALLTESIDIYEPDSDALKFDRVFEFKNLFDFSFQLEALGKLIRMQEIEHRLNDVDYKKILARHSTAARVNSILEASL